MTVPRPIGRNSTQPSAGLIAKAASRPWKSALDIVASVVMIAAGIFVLFFAVRGRRAETAAIVPDQTVKIVDALTMGQPVAPVAMVEFSDFQCPFCAQFARDTLPELVRRYVESGRILIALRHFPVNPQHGFAFMAAEAAECARRQGKGWEMHDLLFHNPGGLSEATVLGFSAALGIEPTAFGDCRKGQAVDGIRRDIEDATKLSIGGTPTFLIGALQSDQTVRVTGRVSGAKPLAVFVVAIDRALSDLALSKIGAR